MIIPIVCFTCNNPISSKWEAYQRILKEKKRDPAFIDNTKLNYDNINNNFKTAENFAMESVGIKRYCCKRMVLGHIDIIEKL
tara:strand:- start:424 stop:669 length:246 start_codon:yes stop_codon:yes gene_type:complete